MPWAARSSSATSTESSGPTATVAGFSSMSCFSGRMTASRDWMPMGNWDSVEMTIRPSPGNGTTNALRGPGGRV